MMIYRPAECPLSYWICPILWTATRGAYSVKM
jgi:hypothetical protein